MRRIGAHARKRSERAYLLYAPSQEIEVLDETSWSGRDALRRMAPEQWTAREPADQDHLTAFSRSGNTTALGDTLLGLLRDTGITVRRLSVRSVEPHLQLHMDLTADSLSASELFKTLRAVGQHVQSS